MFCCVTVFVIARPVEVALMSHLHGIAESF